jgi:hypothetical protein
MLSLLTQTMRFKAAVFMAALYALMVLAPHAAMAFAGTGGLAHCMTEQGASHDHSRDTAAHVHADGAKHAHADDSKTSDSKDDKGPAAVCCGLFSVSAMVNETRLVVPGLATSISLLLPLPDLVEGQGPGRINKPPIA